MTDTILIAEDDDGLRRALRRYLKRTGVEVLEAASCKEALAHLERGGVQLVLADISLPDGLGFEIVDRAAELSPPAQVIVMTSDDRIDNPIQAMQRGASDFLLKPFSFEALDDALGRLVAREAAHAVGRPSWDGTPVDAWRQEYAPEMLGQDRSLLRVFGIIERVCDTDCSVLVTGASGTGKELVARALHRASDRAKKPFVTVNCAAIPENLLESELFGHARGSFTGATASRVGRFTAADTGTLFLDEIGELPLSLQSKLLRVLQEKEVTPVGESKTHKVDVRVIAATNQDVEVMVDRGTFREDLLYRLNVIPIELPALKERRGDIPLFVERFIARANERRKRDIRGISQEALDVMCTYDWPGNVRQLENMVERMVVLRSDGELGLDDLPRQLRRPGVADAGPMDEPTLPEDGLSLRDAVERFENALILQALERTGWNKNRAAAILKMNRTTLVEKLKKKKLDATVAVS